MAGFIQIVEFTTSRIDEMKAISDQQRSGAADRSGARPLRVSITGNRDIPNRYMAIVEFESYESAMENSSLPETDEFSKAMAKLCDGPPTFHNLDVRESFVP